MFIDGEYCWLAELKAFGSTEEECKNIIREKTGFIITSCEEVQKKSTKGTVWEEYGKYEFIFVMPSYDYDWDIYHKQEEYLSWSSNVRWMKEKDYDRYRDDFWKEQERKKKEEKRKENNKKKGLAFLKEIEEAENVYKEKVKKYNLTSILYGS